MSKEGKRAIYECDLGCCFEHKDVGKRVYGICPGGGVWCTRITKEKFKQKHAGVPTKK